MTGSKKFLNTQLRLISALFYPKKLDPIFFTDNMIGLSPNIRNVQELDPPPLTPGAQWGKNSKKTPKLANFETAKNACPHTDFGFFNRFR